MTKQLDDRRPEEMQNSLASSTPEIVQCASTDGHFLLLTGKGRAVHGQDFTVIEDGKTIRPIAIFEEVKSFSRPISVSPNFLTIDVAQNIHISIDIAALELPGNREEAGEFTKMIDTELKP